MQDAGLLSSCLCIVTSVVVWHGGLVHLIIILGYTEFLHSLVNIAKRLRNAKISFLYQLLSIKMARNLKCRQKKTGNESQEGNLGAGWRCRGKVLALANDAVRLVSLRDQELLLSAAELVLGAAGVDAQLAGVELLDAHGRFGEVVGGHVAVVYRVVLRIKSIFRICSN